MRQWVLSLPYRIRFLLGYDPELLTHVRRIFARSVLALVRALAKHQWGIDSDLQLNVHFHMLVLDGVYTRDDSGTMTFTELRSPSPADLERLTHNLHRSILRFLRKRGKLPARGRDGRQTAPRLTRCPLTSCAWPAPCRACRPGARGGPQAGASLRRA